MSIGINGEINSIHNLGKIKEAEFPQAAQRPDSKTISEAQASFTNNILQSNNNVKSSASVKHSIEKMTTKHGVNA